MPCGMNPVSENSTQMKTWSPHSWPCWTLLLAVTLALVALGCEMTGNLPDHWDYTDIRPVIQLEGR